MLLEKYNLLLYKKKSNDDVDSDYSDDSDDSDEKYSNENKRSNNFFKKRTKNMINKSNFLSLGSCKFPPKI